MTKFKLTILILLITAFGVVVSGCVKKPQPAVNVNQPVNTNTSTTTAEVDTSDWKTYRNEEYGFEFKYPGDSIVLTNSEKVQFYEKDAYNADHNIPLFELEIVNEKLDLEDFLRQRFSLLKKYSDLSQAVSNEPGVYAYQRLVIGGVKGVMLSIGDSRRIDNYVFYVNNSATIVILSNHRTFNEIFDKILSSVVVFD